MARYCKFCKVVELGAYKTVCEECKAIKAKERIVQQNEKRRRQRKGLADGEEEPSLPDWMLKRGDISTRGGSNL